MEYLHILYVILWKCPRDDVRTEVLKDTTMKIPSSGKRAHRVAETSGTIASILSTRRRVRIIGDDSSRGIGLIVAFRPTCFGKHVYAYIHVYVHTYIHTTYIYA